jgi:hypothetical protein
MNSHADFLAAVAAGDIAGAKRIMREVLREDERALAEAPPSASRVNIGSELISQMWADERAAAPELYGPKKRRKRR